jgi:hypothetical protein
MGNLQPENIVMEHSDPCLSGGILGDTQVGQGGVAACLIRLCGDARGFLSLPQGVEKKGALGKGHLAAMLWIHVKNFFQKKAPQKGIFRAGLA